MRRLRSVPRVVTGLCLLLLALGGPRIAAASTGPDPSPPPCDLPSSTVTAGTPLVLRGPARTESAMVGVMARSSFGGFREGAVTISDGRWQAILVFGAEDWGSWIVDVAVDGADCVSPLTVTLPAGVVPPPRHQEAPADPAARPTGPTGSDIAAAVAIAVAIAVLASYATLSVVAIASVLRLRPLRRRGLRSATQIATFVAVLGTGLGTAGFLAVGYSMAHFDTGLSSADVTVIQLAMAAVLVAGSTLGVVAARRVPGRATRQAT